MTSLGMSIKERWPMLHDLGKRTLIMGILNVTPDSFSDGGFYVTVEQVVSHALSMQEEGADIIDIGAESTRPSATPLSMEEEWDRLAPVLSEVRRAVSIAISIDTYKAEVARRALTLGVDMVNDVCGGKKDPEMNEVVAGSGAQYVIMHNGMGHPEVTDDIVQHVKAELENQVAVARIAGVTADQIVIDPGIGFGKTTKQNLELINRVDELKVLGYPVLVGTSRKSLIGQVLNVPVSERVEGTASTVAVAIVRGADIVRVHDVAHMARIVKMTDSLVRAR